MAREVIRFIGAVVWFQLTLPLKIALVVEFWIYMLIWNLTNTFGLYMTMPWTLAREAAIRVSRCMEANCIDVDRRLDWLDGYDPED